MIIFFSLQFFEELKATDESEKQEDKTPKVRKVIIEEDDTASKVRIIESEDDFDEQMENAGSKLVVVNFSAKWCGPCKNIAPFMVELAKNYKSHIIVLKIDVDDLQELAMFQHKVSSMPTFIFFKQGQQIERFSGADARRIEETVKKFST